MKVIEAYSIPPCRDLESRLIRADDKTVTFKIKDYRLEGRRRQTTMTLATPDLGKRK